MAKTKVQLQDVGDILANLSEPFQAPAMLTSGTAYNAITVTDLQGNKRAIQDPSKTVRPVMGIERISARSIKLATEEKGPNGEQVWKLDSGDDRIRFIGSWAQDSSALGPNLVTSTVGDFIEITFYGTGLNILAPVDSTTRNLYVTLDGGSEVLSTIYPNAASTNINSRNYSSNQILSAVSNQSLGIHTIRLRQGAGSTNIRFYGFEILNEASTIKLPPGRVLANGRSASINSLQSLNYNTDFEGSPTLNGRGGRVVIYSDGSQVKKAIQQTDASALYLSSANHSNEEVIRRVNFREFGTNRADDFSTLTTTSTRAFTLNDGTTSLTGLSVAVGGTPEYFGAGDSNAATSRTITFVGTGLDLYIFEFGSATTRVNNLIVDGVSIAALPKVLDGKYKILKIVSGLPYGTHTVKLDSPAATGNTDPHFIVDFLIYGPKKPSIPEGAVELGEYYLMGDYNASSITGTTLNDNIQMPLGVLSKADTREHVYIGAGWAANGPNSTTITAPSGINLQTAAAINTDNFSYTFFGTGVNLHLFCSSTGVYTVSVLIDGVANATGTNLVNMTNGGGGSYSTTSTTNGAPARLGISGLTLGLHTVKVTKTVGAGTWGLYGVNIITPIHFPDTKVGSLALKPAIEVKQLAKESNVDLSKAKAWLVYDTSTTKIISSYNIAAVLQVSTSNIKVFFEKPFNQEPVIAIASSASVPIQTGDINGGASGNKRWSVSLYASATFTTVQVVFFGELLDEESE